LAAPALSLRFGGQQKAVSNLPAGSHRRFIAEPESAGSPGIAGFLEARMMKKQNNKGLLLVLLTASLLTWGMIGYQIIWGVSFEEEMAEQFVPISADSTIGQPAYDDRFLAEVQYLRNPFREKRRPPKKIARKAKAASAPAAIKPPRLSFVGLLGDANGGLAIIGDKDGSTHICGIGDQVSGARLKSIEKSEVEMEFEGQVFVIRLQ
jgi:hypothetical protein